MTEVQANVTDVLERIDDAFFALDDDWRITFLNETAAEILDVSRDQVVGEVVWDEFETAVDTTFQREYERAMAEQEPVSFEEYYPPLEAWFEVNAYPGEDGLSVYFRDITERVERERELERYESIVETAQDGIYVIDSDGYFQAVNESYAELTGYEADELIGTHASEVVDEETRAAATDLERDLKSGDRTTASLETTVQRADGETREVEATFSLLPDGDRVGVVRDITERTERERELEQFRALTRAAQDVILTIDEASTIRMVNPAVEDVFGYEPEELVGEDLTMLMPERFRGDHLAGLQAYLETGERHLDWEQIELPGLTADGEEITLGISFGEVEYQGERYFTGTIRDITERKEREAALERMRDLLHKTERIADIGGWEIDPETMDVFWSDHLFQMLGVDADEEPPLDEALELYVDEDRPTVEAAVERALDEGEPFDVEVRFRRADDGEIRWLRVQGVPTVEDGEVTMLRGTAQDVTERREREADIKRTRDRNKALFENSPDMIDVLDLDGRILEVNQGMCRALGYEEEKLLGRHIWEVDAAVDEDDVRSLFAEMDAGDTRRFESEYERRDGSTFPIEVNISRVQVSDEPRILGVVRDITERKAREQRLERYERVIETVDDGVYALDDDGRFLMVNEAFCDLTGYDRAELIGEHASLVKDESVTERADRLTEELAAGEREQAEMEFEIETRSSERVPVESRIDQFPVDGGVGRCSVVRDISDRKAFERRLVALHGVSRDLLRAESDEEIARIASDALHDILDAPAAGFFRYDDAADRLVPTVVSEGSIVSKDALPTLRPGEGLVGAVFDRQETRLLDDVEESEQYTEPNEDVGVRSAVLASVGDEGVLAAGSPEVGVFDDETDELIELVSTATEAAFSRIEREQQLRTQVDQQAVVTALGRRALADQDLDSLMADAARLVAGTLDTDYCGILDLDPDEDGFVLRQGVGWDDGVVGSTTIRAIGNGSQAGYTLTSETPVVVEDLESESRFEGSRLLADHDVRSGVSTIIGPDDDPWGVLGVHGTERRQFSEQAVNFVQSVANVLAAAIARHEDEAALRSQRDRLSALNDINSLVHNLSESMFGLSEREEIEELVCKRLAASDSYEFAWIGTTEGDEVTVSTEAGVEDYLDDIRITLDGPGDQGPTAQAHLTREMQVVRNAQTDPRYDPWREHAREHGYSASAAIPLVDGDELQGTLNIYSRRSDAFGEEERDALRRLGSIIAYAFASVERDRQLQRERNRLEFMNRLLRHNLLNSLNVVKARLDLLDGQVDYEVSGHLETAVDRTQEMIRFVETVREVTKVIGRGDEQERKPRAIEDVLESRVENAQRTYPHAQFQLDETPEVDVVADNLLGEVLDNVLINAVQHNPSEQPTVWVDATADAETVEVTIADDGPGIPDEQKSRVFDREAKDFDDPGSGFGLYLVKEIVDSYGGDITVEDNEPEGARFRLTFQRA